MPFYVDGLSVFVIVFVILVVLMIFMGVFASHTPTARGTNYRFG